MKIIRPYHPPSLKRHGLQNFTLRDCTGPLDLEIGSGVGWFAIRYAKHHPERTLIAIERTKTRSMKFERRLNSHPNLNNLILVSEAAEDWLPFALSEETVDRLFILYPNPYVKKSQHRRRWHYQPFMRFLLSLLKPGGTLHLASNVQEYAEQASEQYSRYWGLKKVSYEFYQGKPRTHFEKKYQDRGESLCDLIFQKKQD